MNKKKFPVPIYLIRHGEAESSWDQDSNPGLSKKGKRQSLELATSLKNYILEEKFTIISSPLRRALETAQPMLESNNLTFSINKIFSEIPSPGIELSDRKEWLSHYNRQNIINATDKNVGFDQFINSELVGD